MYAVEKQMSDSFMPFNYAHEILCMICSCFVISNNFRVKVLLFATLLFFQQPVSQIKSLTCNVVFPTKQMTI